MIKVGIPAYHNTAHAGRGIGVYGTELTKRLRLLDDIEVVEFDSVDQVLDQVDLIHFLHFDFFAKTLPARLRKPVVVTVPDVTPLVFPKHYPSGIKGKIKLFWQKNSLKKVARVLTISEASKSDITRYLGVSKDRIDVVYLGFSDRFKQIKNNQFLNEVKAKYKLPDRFAFYSGNVNWNKNIVNMASFCIESGIDLVIVGKSFGKKENMDHPEMRSYKMFVERFEGNPHIHVLGFVPDDDLVAILNQATVSLFISYYEGFGFPILEAQACGIPVITSKTSSMPEVAGKGAILVDPNELFDTKNALEKIEKDEQFRHELVHAGFENIKRFNWQKCADETAQVYRDVLR